MKILYTLWQCTYGAIQTLSGFIVFLLHYKNKHFWYHGALVTVWNDTSSVSLGMFVFITKEPFFAEKYKGQISANELSERLLVHEYGHTVQSLILGPLYFIVIGIPSTLWGLLGSKKRKEKQIPYCALFTEKWANRLGEAITKKESLGDLILE